MNRRVLLVDDEQNLLLGLKRHLRKDFELEVAVGGAAALELIDQSSNPFAVVVSDMRMPEMSGLELLNAVRSRNSQTIRVMLTGNADQKTAVDAINEGSIFRFLCKPCEPAQLAKTLEAGIEQYRLVTAEAELLSKTLSGSVRVLTQVLSLAMPEAFGQAHEARALCRAIGQRLEVDPLWQLEMAAMLMRIGCVSLPQPILHKFLNGEELPVAGKRMVAETPRIGADLIGAIPRLKGVAELIRDQLQPAYKKPPLAASILRVIGDFQRWRSHGSPREAIQKLRDAKLYDQAPVEILASFVNSMYESREVMISELTEGMVLDADVVDGSGRVLLASGHEIHSSVVQKLNMLRFSGTGVHEPIRVRVLNLDNPMMATGRT